jgi:GNAT superfamily N-acetyltransferase
VRISIRPAVATDEEFVNALTRTVMRPYVEATWQSDTEREDYYRLNRFQQDGTAIIQVDGIDTGRMTITREAGRLVLDEIHLLPDYQGRGIGQILIRQVLNEADGLGIPTERPSAT